MKHEAVGCLCLRLSTLHFGLNAGSALFHVAYNWDFKAWTTYRSNDPDGMLDEKSTGAKLMFKRLKKTKLSFTTLDVQWIT